MCMAKTGIGEHEEPNLARRREGAALDPITTTKLSEGSDKIEASAEADKAGGEPSQGKMKLMDGRGYG